MKDLVKVKAKAEFCFSLTPEERLARNLPTTDANIAKYVGVTSVTICSWRKQWTEKKNPKKPLTDLSPKEKIEQFDNLLYDLANDPKSPSKYKELFARRHGLLVDKQETKVKVEIGADEIARRYLEADRRIKEWESQRRGSGDRVVDVQEESPVLLGEVCVDNGQGGEGDSEVGAVAVPS